MGGQIKKKRRQCSERQVKREGRVDAHRAFRSPALHTFLPLIYEWDSITLMPSINCSRFLSFVPLIHKRGIRRAVTLTPEV